MNYHQMVPLVSSGRSPVISLQRTPTKVQLLDVSLDLMPVHDAAAAIVVAAKEREPLGCCCVGMHTFINARKDPRLKARLDNIALKLLDSTPGSWFLRLKGCHSVPKVRGQDLMSAVCKQCEEAGLSVFFFGSNPPTLEALGPKLKARYPRLKVAGYKPGRYRVLSEAEQQQDVDDIIGSEADVVFVGLGSPRQDIWVYEMADKLQRPLLAVGAAFDFEAGTVKTAPRLVQTIGMEWLFRLLSEPRRLWRRYLLGGPRFVWLLATYKRSPFDLAEKLPAPADRLNLG